MRTRVALALGAVFALVALLLPAGSAQAAWRDSPWCQSTVLKSGQSCTSWPLSVNNIYTSWVVTESGTGRVCVGLTQYGGSHHGLPVNGVPGLSCTGVSWRGTYGPSGDVGNALWVIYRYNPYMRYSYSYGQARIINYSSATIKTYYGLYGTSIHHWL